MPQHKRKSFSATTTAKLLTEVQALIAQGVEVFQASGDADCDIVSTAQKAAEAECMQRISIISSLSPEALQNILIFNKSHNI